VPLAGEAGFELVDVEIVVQGRQRVIRLLLDKPGGITLGDCATFSRRLADGLDMNQTVAGSYRLEVSSPGMDRPITSPEAAAQFAGQQVALTAALPRDGRRHFDGTLLGPDEDGRIGVRLEDGSEHWFGWAEVRSVRLAVDPWERLRAARGEAGPARERGPGARRPRGRAR